MMHNPPHPGEILRADYLEPLGLSVTEAARALGVTRKTLSAVLNERAAISPAMAHRLSKALDSTPEFWVNLQAQCDLWQARDTKLDEVGAGRTRCQPLRSRYHAAVPQEQRTTAGR